MNASIQKKLLVLCVLLVLLTTSAISAIYYVLTKQDKHHESQQRIQIAFDIIFDHIQEQSQTYTQKFNEFLQRRNDISLTAEMYAGGMQVDVNLQQFLTAQLTELASIVAAERLTVYGVKEIFKITPQTLQALKNEALPETVRTRLTPLENQPGQAEKEFWQALAATLEPESAARYKELLLKSAKTAELSVLADYRRPNPQKAQNAADSAESSLPAEAAPVITGTLPTTAAVELFNAGRYLGVKLTVPILREQQTVGILVGEMLFTQSMAARYKALSKTEVNFFGGNQLGIGTLLAQTELEPQALEHSLVCEALQNGNQEFEVYPVTYAAQPYYQSRCALKNAAGNVGAITVSLSQEFEKQAIRKTLLAVLLVAGLVSIFAIGLAVIVSRPTIHGIQGIVKIIGAVSAGDLRPTAIAVTRDEIGMLARKLNQMIMQFRSISIRVQGAADTVNATADTILREMESFIQHLQQQSTSIEHATFSITRIKQFIDTVAHKTSDLLSAAAQVLASIQETRASIQEVAVSTGSLVANLHLISAAVEQVNHTVKYVAETSAALETTAQQTETEIQRIDQSLQEVSRNADHTRQLAKETTEAATSGQVAVAAALRGMSELKAVVAQTAQIIQEINRWGAEVTAILDMVDEITAQTSLLALNASIISAQAGVQGRGFAVVADEIKELATRTKVSTKNIETLVHKLQQKTTEGVTHTGEGLRKADQGMQLAGAVKDALAAILERATRSSDRAADTVQVIQQTVGRSQVIRTHIQRVTEMVSQISLAMHEQGRDLEQVVSAVENISGMAEQVSRANVEQKRAAEEIEHSMADVTDQFSELSEQTETLQQSADQIATAVETIESTTTQILQNTMTFSEETVKNLVQQSEALQGVVNVFKVS